MTKTIIEAHPDGTPLGSYGITYYRVSKSGEVSQDAGCDSNVSEAYVRKACSMLQEHEALEATCNSQRGGLSAYGSERARRAMKAQS